MRPTRRTRLQPLPTTPNKHRTKNGRPPPPGKTKHQTIHRPIQPPSQNNQTNRTNLPHLRARHKTKRPLGSRPPKPRHTHNIPSRSRTSPPHLQPTQGKQTPITPPTPAPAQTAGVSLYPDPPPVKPGGCPKHNSATWRRPRPQFLAYIGCWGFSGVA